MINNTVNIDLKQVLERLENNMIIIISELNMLEINNVGKYKKEIKKMTKLNLKLIRLMNEFGMHEYKLTYNKMSNCDIDALSTSLLLSLNTVSIDIEIGLVESVFSDEEVDEYNRLMNIIINKGDLINANSRYLAKLRKNGTGNEMHKRNKKAAAKSKETAAKSKETVAKSKETVAKSKETVAKKQKKIVDDKLKNAEHVKSVKFSDIDDIEIGSTVGNLPVVVRYSLKNVYSTSIRVVDVGKYVLMAGSLCCLSDSKKEADIRIKSIKELRQSSRDNGTLKKVQTTSGNLINKFEVTHDITFESIRALKTFVLGRNITDDEDCERLYVKDVELSSYLKLGTKAQ